MKRLIIVVFLGLLVSPVASAQTAPLTNPEPPLVIGFADGNMYNPVTGEWKCAFLMDGNCYDTDQKVITTRPANYTPPVTTVPESTPQTVYVPVYIPVENNQPVVQQPSPTPVVSTPTVSPTLKSAYTEVELLVKFRDLTPESRTGAKKPATVSNYWPVSPAPGTRIGSHDSVSFGWQRSYEVYKDCKLIFQGNEVLPLNKKVYHPEIIAEYPNDPSGGYRDYSLTVTGLTPDTRYEYQLVYVEPGREDTVITKHFLTALPH